MKNLTIMAALLVSAPVFAQEVSDNVVTEPKVDEFVTQKEVLHADFTEICELAQIGKIVMTPEATEACINAAFPRVINDGTRFTNRGVGSEINTLIRNFATSQEVDS